jgi:hypothetical protein
MIGMIKMTQHGSFRNAERFFDNSKNLSRRLRTAFERYGAQGVEALRSATPIDSGLTADSWSYTIENWGIGFNNSNIQNGYSVALLLQYGHGMRNGAYVEGIDFINPALKPIFDLIARECWREVQNL